MLNELPARLSDSIIGQDHIIPKVVSVLQRGQLGLSRPGRPRGSFLFLGPTGVGKTECTLAFSKLLFGENAVQRFDMSEYQTKESLARLLGENRSDCGFLGEAMQPGSQGTILFDEIEKAHPEILDVFLQILDAARVTVATGNTLDFSNYYLVLTSNIGSANLVDLQYSSFSTIERHVLLAARTILRPEIFARVTERLVFKPLTYEIQLKIAELFIERELCFMKKQGHQLFADESVLPLVIKMGFDSKLGARPLRDTVEKLIGDAVTTEILKGKGANGWLTNHEPNSFLEIQTKNIPQDRNHGL
ncbi:MAG: AAA family ATPase [Verrucomicrobiales bacterium]